MANPYCVIRPFQPEDKEQVHALFAAGMRWYPEHQQGQPLHAFVESYIGTAIRDDLDPATGMHRIFLDGKSGFWCAIDTRDGSPTHGVVVGIVGGQALAADPYKTWAGPVMELRRMSVHDGARGLGLATKLTATLEAHALRNGIGRVVLSTGSVMTPAQRMYERCGYVKDRYVAFDDPSSGIPPEEKALLGLDKATGIGYVVYSKVLPSSKEPAQAQL